MNSRSSQSESTVYNQNELDALDDSIDRVEKKVNILLQILQQYESTSAEV